MPEQIVIETGYTHTTSFAFSLEARKVAAKIALAAVAFEYGIPFALSAEFDVLGRLERPQAIRTCGLDFCK